MTALLAACGRSSHPAPASAERPPGPATTPAAGHSDAPAAAPTVLSLAELGIDGVDAKADPCTDFYRYACGGYAAAAPPAGRARWSRLDDAIAAAATTVGAALAPLQAACLDGKARAAAGLKALRPLRKTVAAVKNEKTLAVALGTLHRHGVAAAFSIAVGPDFHDGRTIILHLDQEGALTLGDRNYYLSAKDALDGAKEAARLRRAYQDQVRAVFAANGRSAADARTAARDVIRVETALAVAARSRYERRAPELLYDRVERAGLATLAPDVDWPAYFTALGRADIDGISVTSRRYVKALGHLSKSLPATAWRAYLDWRLLFALADAATPELSRTRSEVLARVGRAPSAATPELTCARAIAAALPDLAGAALMAAVPDPAREQLGADARAIQTAMAERAGASGWMTRATRALAADKLGAVDLVIGVPPWMNAGDPPRAGGYLAQILAARARDTDRQLAAVGRASGTSFDVLSPAARYEWLGNRVILPPAALAYPAARAPAPAAARLGALALGAGHELFHAVDDHGARWNRRGGRGPWWQESDRDGWREHGGCFVAWAVNHKIADDGAAVADEMRADAAGLAAAFRAYRARAAGDGPFHVTGPDGATVAPDRLFFLAAASSECARVRNGDGAHVSVGRPAARERINAAVAATPAFAAAFSCPAGAPMHPAEACEVW